MLYQIEAVQLMPVTKNVNNNITRIPTIVSTETAASIQFHKSNSYMLTATMDL